jgi:hypothetical protein
MLTLTSVLEEDNEDSERPKIRKNGNLHGKGILEKRWKSFGSTEQTSKYP